MEWLCSGCGYSTYGDKGVICIKGICDRNKRYHQGCATCRWCDKFVNKETAVAVWGTNRLRQKIACIECSKHLDVVGGSRSLEVCSGCGYSVDSDDAGTICLEVLGGLKNWYHLDCAKCHECDKHLTKEEGFERVWGTFRMRQKLMCLSCLDRSKLEAVSTVKSNTKSDSPSSFGATIRSFQKSFSEHALPGRDPRAKAGTEVPGGGEAVPRCSSVQLDMCQRHISGGDKDAKRPPYPTLMRRCATGDGELSIVKLPATTTHHELSRQDSGKIGSSSEIKRLPTLASFIGHHNVPASPLASRNI